MEQKIKEENVEDNVFFCIDRRKTFAVKPLQKCLFRNTSIFQFFVEFCKIFQQECKVLAHIKLRDTAEGLIPLSPEVCRMHKQGQSGISAQTDLCQCFFTISKFSACCFTKMYCI